MAPTVPIEFAGQKESRKRSLSQTMGKSRKYSKGHSSGFVPDYRHAVETMGESEGLGSSGRGGMEMTVSEYSCAPKRKSISLNVDNLGVPMQVLSLSRMSRFERKDLELKLKMELEQIRVLQKKVDSLCSNAVVLSPSSDIRSCSDGRKRPPLVSSHKLSEVSVPQSKKRAPPAPNGPRTKRSTFGRFESVRRPANSSSIATLMKQCKNLLTRLMSHPFAWVFNSPVDAVELNIPDYFTVIKHPMDLGTVKSKIASGDYSSPLGFAADVRLTFSNAMTYNPPGDDAHIMAETLNKYFEVKWKAIEKKLPGTMDVQLVPSRPGLHLETRNTSQIPPSIMKKPISPDACIKPETVRRIINEEEKHKLSMELEALVGELPESIVEFLKAHSEGPTNEDEIEVDIDALSDDNLIRLRKLLDDYFLEKQKNEANVEPCEIEVLNESGLSNSSMQPCKGNDLVDEDVDIVEIDVDIVGGNDPPISSFPPVEIEKDAAHRNIKCSSSSSSSSESGSSSSDSDSASSSESESNDAKASVPRIAAEEKLNSGASLDQKSDLGGSEIQSINGEAQVEQNSHSKPLLVGVDNHNEGESAPSDRQVSPDKLYRAAFLRSRFADTILKAREKALEKGEKQDPEKLRKDREELERQQKEEKARLQAEAKAAEEARKKAEAEAATEAKKKRELEREAARQALQQMEKTVDINENSQFMKDLELLRAAGDEHLPNFMDEAASPEHTQNVLGSFKIQGSNPLELLGLYMKEDEEDEEDEDDEEEGEPPQKLPEQSNDVEEGEID